MTRNRIVLFFGLSVTALALVVLSAGLSRIELREGTLFTSEAISELKFLLGQFRIYQGLVMGVILIVSLVIFVWSLFTKRKFVAIPRSKGKFTFWIQIILWVIAIWMLRRQLINRNLSLLPLELAPITNYPMEDSILAASSQISDWYAFLCSMALFLGVGFLLWITYRRRRQPVDRLELITQEARSAIQTLQAGDELRNVILRCYYQMAHILYEKRGIQRKQAMTPREFGRRLNELGFPAEPVRQLTQLFEAVRYGAKDLDEKAERQAIACLDAIVRTGDELS